MRPIITSFLDTDFYKLTMGQAVWKMAPNVLAKYKFHCRGGQDLTWIIASLKDEIKNLMCLSIDSQERSYLEKLTVKDKDGNEKRIFENDYLNYLSKLPMDRVTVTISDTCEIEIKGPWQAAIYLEVPILAIINELYYKGINSPLVSFYNLEDTLSTIRKVDGIRFSDFGTRRRRSLGWHQDVIKHCVQRNFSQFLGTSNVRLAMEHGIRPIGTMAHEWIQAGQALCNPMDSQRMMFAFWHDLYPYPMRIALSDTLGDKKFLRDWTKETAEAYAGVRHDSGDPFIWTETLLAHYDKIGVDARNKTFVYSDCITANKAVEIYEKYHNKVGISFGIGTNLTNDFGPKEAPAMQNVIKLVELNGRPIAKLSSVSGKEICTSSIYMQWLKEMLNKEEVCA